MATILIVEVEPPIRELLVGLLTPQPQGHRLLEASDGAEGLAVAQAERPDLIISAILMLEMDGYEFVRQVRADPALAQTPIIFYTAPYGEAEARALAQAWGVPYVLTQSSEPEAMLHMIETVLGSTLSPLPLPPPEVFDREHIRWLTHQLSEKVDELKRVNERLKGEVQRRNRELALLNQVIAAFAAGLKPEAVLDIACRELALAFDLPYAALCSMRRKGRLRWWPIMQRKTRPKTDRQCCTSPTAWPPILSSNTFSATKRP